MHLGVDGRVPVQRKPAGAASASRRHQEEGVQAAEQDGMVGDKPPVAAPPRGLAVHKPTEGPCKRGMNRYAPGRRANPPVQPMIFTAPGRQMLCQSNVAQQMKIITGGPGCHQYSRRPTNAIASAKGTMNCRASKLNGIFGTKRRFQFASGGPSGGKSQLFPSSLRTRTLSQ